MKNVLKPARIAVLALLLGAPLSALADASCGADTIGLDTQSWPFLEAALEQAAAAHAGLDEPHCVPPAAAEKLRIEAAERAPLAAKLSKRANPCVVLISESRCGRNELLDRVVPMEGAGARPAHPGGGELKRVRYKP